MTRTTLATALSLAALGALLATGCATSTEVEEGTADTSSELRRGLAADGDACTVRTLPDGTKIPGTVNGIDCCSTADPTDCVIILKPFPKSFALAY